MSILSSDVLQNEFLNLKAEKGDLLGTNSYDEVAIIEKIKKLPLDDQIILYKIALSISIIGAGGKNFNDIIHNKKTLETLKEMDRLKIKYSLSQNAKLEIDDLTPRRLVRIFRLKIREFIIREKRPSYLYVKYCDDKQKYKNYENCFPGSEHFIEQENVEFLLSVHKNLDEIHNMNTVQRLKSIFLARGLKVQSE
jgi:hypothetical protein